MHAVHSLSKFTRVIHKMTAAGCAASPTAPYHPLCTQHKPKPTPIEFLTERRDPRSTRPHEPRNRAPVHYFLSSYQTAFVV